jgi:hypothetical protein
MELARIEGAATGGRSLNEIEFSGQRTTRPRIAMSRIGRNPYPLMQTSVRGENGNEKQPPLHPLQG